MPTGYQIDKQDGVYFLTLTVVGWANLFIRESYKQIMADSFNYCTEHLGLEIYSYVIMSSHLHLIASAKNNNLSTVIGSFKKYTCRELIKEIRVSGESRREQMLKEFSEAGEKNKRNKNFQVWQQHNHAEEVYSPKFTLSKIQYIHNNPVEEGIVERPEDYLYSSARDYAGRKSPVDISLIELHILF